MIDVLEELTTLVADNPGATARELVREFRLAGISVDKRVINSALYANPDLFIRVGDGQTSAPSWFVATRAASQSSRPAPVGGPEILRSITLNKPLYQWQEDALTAWRVHAFRGVVEAVTGTGKTMVGLAAIAEELTRGGKALVVVPTKELQRQWLELIKKSSAGVRVGCIGGGSTGCFRDSDVLIAVVNSVRSGDLDVPREALIVADECHRYGSESNQGALDERFTRRLGLSATYDRPGDGRARYLDPFFHQVCFSLGYGRALKDNVIARFAVALIGTEFSKGEAAEYATLSTTVSKLKTTLTHKYGITADPIGEFMLEASRLAKEWQGPATLVARQFLVAFAGRKKLLAETPIKLSALAKLVPAVRASNRTIVFTETIGGAQSAQSLFQRFGVAAACIHSGLDDGERCEVLDAFREDGALKVVTAPRVLDEGVDVPEVDLAVIVAASQTRRQMIQRMGRIVRRKADGRMARFAILYVADTSEDPSQGAHGMYLKNMEEFADAVADFPASAQEADICAFLNALTPEAAQIVARTWPRPSGKQVRAGVELQAEDKEARGEDAKSNANRLLCNDALEPTLATPGVWMSIQGDSTYHTS